MIESDPLYAGLGYTVPGPSIPWQNIWVRIPYGAIDTVGWIRHVSRNLIRCDHGIYHAIVTGSNSFYAVLDYVLPGLFIPWQNILGSNPAWSYRHRGMDRASIT